jgi:hypothetical protein
MGPRSWHAWFTHSEVLDGLSSMQETFLSKEIFGNDMSLSKLKEQHSQLDATTNSVLEGKGKARSTPTSHHCLRTTIDSLRSRDLR